MGIEVGGRRGVDRRSIVFYDSSSFLFGPELLESYRKGCKQMNKKTVGNKVFYTSFTVFVRELIVFI